ncbi:MAG: DUF4185 domain-containing protein [Phycisphaerales bacterium]|nr:DUF4185 domain-containing protein [Phycisphaerales bacterium]
MKPFTPAYPKSDAIKGLRWLSKAKKYDACRGDTFSCTWADDDQLYTCADDTYGVNWAYKSNLACLRVEGMPPNHQIFNVNPMEAYFPFATREGQDTWKACSTLFVDGALYMSMSQHSWAGQYPDCIQRTYDSHIIKSTDYGKTWSPKRAIGNAMWPGPRFANPFFVQFGKAYAGAMDDYIYAVSNSATWNNGNYMILGRVLREKLGQLNTADWEYFGGTEADNDAKWITDLGKAVGIFKHRGRASMIGMQWVPALERFIMPQWAYMDLDRDDPWHETLLAIYEAPKPWGPWRHVHTEMNWGQAEYGPCLPAKWFEENGKRCWLVSSGDFTRQKENSPYSFTVQQLEWLV